LTAGESHGPALTAILEGMPAGLPLSPADLDHDLIRRQRGFGSGGRMKIERDRVRISAGVTKGHTTGGPIALHVENLDWPNWEDRDVPPFTVPRPGHADLTGGLKYGYSDLRPALERASARETTMRVAVGAICKKLLAAFDITVGSYVTEIGGVMVQVSPARPYTERFALAEENDVRCPEPRAVEPLRARIRRAQKDRDTVGGVFEVVALNVPPGLGSHVHWDRKLEARLAQAIVSIPAVKGVEIGPAFANARLSGTQVHDEILLGEDGEIVRPTNRAGGFEGGITTGQPIVVRAAMKPISTTLKPLRSVDLATGEAAPTVYERSDFTAVPRAAVVGEAMLAFVLADALVEKLGGDSLAEMQRNYQAMREAQRTWLRTGVRGDQRVSE